MVVSYLAFTPNTDATLFQVSDVVLHALAFTYLTAALWVAHHQGESGLAPALWMLGYAVAIEAIQSTLPERSAEVKDLVVDAVGIGLGLGLYRLLERSLTANARLRRDSRSETAPTDPQCAGSSDRSSD